jgi:hypothetical protein
MWAVGLMDGESRSAPRFTCTNSPSRTTEYRKLPQVPQCASWLPESPWMRSPAEPDSTRKFGRSMPANDLNADPVERRHCEQWQFRA